MSVASEYIDALFRGEIIDTTYEPDMTVVRLRREAWRLQDGRCFYCGKPLARGQITADHIIPRSRGGEDVRGNIAAACADCNSRKGRRTGEEFLLLNEGQSHDRRY